MRWATPADTHKKAAKTKKNTEKKKHEVPSSREDVYRRDGGMDQETRDGRQNAAWSSKTKKK
jgi:hypothetical protein